MLFFHFLFLFFLKKDLSKYLDNKSFAFPKKLGFLFPCGFGVFLLVLSLTSSLKLSFFPSFFPLPFCLWTGESSLSELYLTLRRGKQCERRKGLREEGEINN